MKDAISDNNDTKAVGLAAAGSDAGAINASPETASPKTAGPETGERPSLFCGLDGTCVNPHDAIPLNTRDTFARNFMSHFAAALGETLHAA